MAIRCGSGPASTALRDWVRRAYRRLVLLTHPDVTSAACVGRADEARGEEVVAVVALQPGSTTTSEELIAYGKERLAKYKYPREIVIVDNVPLTSVGKTDRKAVRGLIG